MLFHDDFHARQVFDFLRAETVGDLEQHSPQEIIHRLSRPDSRNGRSQFAKGPVSQR